MKETENKANKISWLYGLAIFQLTVSLIFIATLIYIASELPTEEFWEGFLGPPWDVENLLRRAEHFRWYGASANSISSPTLASHHCLREM